MIYGVFQDSTIRIWKGSNDEHPDEPTLLLEVEAKEILRRCQCPKVGIELLDDASIKSCTGCGAPIVWGETANGKRCPFSVALLVKDTTGRWMMGTHFADCPNAGGFRKR